MERFEAFRPLHGKTSDCCKINGILRHALSEDRIILVKIGLDESHLVSAQIRISLHRRTHGKHKPRTWGRPACASLNDAGGNEAGKSGVSGPAVWAGGFVTAALSLILLAPGTGLVILIALFSH